MDINLDKGANKIYGLIFTLLSGFVAVCLFTSSCFLTG